MASQTQYYQIFVSKMQRLFLVLFFLSLLFSCNDSVEDCYWYEYYDSGKLKAVECFNHELQLRNRREFFENGKLSDNYFVNAGDKLEGEFRTYYENGNLNVKLALVNGKVQGFRYDYFPTGEIETVTYYKDDKEFGIRTFHHPNGNLRSFFYMSDGHILYEKRHFNGRDTAVENYYPIVSINPTSLSVGDTAVISFDIPLPADSFSLAGFNVVYAVIPQADSTTKKIYIDPDFLDTVPIVDRKATSKVEILGRGKLEIVGYLTKASGKQTKNFEFFNHDIYVKEAQ